MTHSRPEETGEALRELASVAAQAGADLVVDHEEAAKHGISPTQGLLIEDGARDVELCVVLGGDGTILRALRRFGPEVPVVAVNFGTIGFLATLDRDGVDEAFRRACAHDFELLPLPGMVLDSPSGPEVALNDISFHRRLGDRVAELAYSIDGEEVGFVRCDGLVVATPAGSTGYNLANGGPILAWGVEGFVVSFIAPHTLTARALVVAPADVITVSNRSRQPLLTSVDGRPVGDLPPGESLEARFRPHAGTLAQIPGSSFYRRLRAKFGAFSR
jgi:NAD+ kinase